VKPVPQFSVIIPCYNCAGTVVETIDSLVKQSFPDYEIIAVDDGSTDDTLAVLQKIAAETEADIQIHTQPNAGVSAARNRGIRMSRGEYILFLDADDLLADGLLQTIGGFLKEKPVDTLCFLYTRQQEQLTSVTGAAVEETAVMPLLERLTYSKRDVLFCCFAYKASILRDRNLWYTEGARYGEDWEFTTKYLANCTDAARLGRFGYYYRQHETSAMANVRYAQTDAIASAHRTHKYLLECGHPFAEDFGVYMYPRAVFSVAHKFGQARNRELFDRLRKEHDMKSVMVRMVKNPNVDLKSKLAAAAYLVSPSLYYLISIF
jgi:glycosyltransferase involved in cell wall biosynthesis